MRPLNVILYVLVFAPVILLTGYSLSSFQYSTNPFILLGMLSLFLLYFSERIKWYGLALVYFPAVYSLYLLVFEQNPMPFVSLAAGYVISLPIMIIFSSFLAYSASALISGFLAGYLTSLALYSAAVNGYTEPNDLFIYLVRIITGRIVEGSTLVGNVNPLEELLKVLTAISIVSLFILVSLLDGKKVFEKGIKLENKLLVNVIVAMVISLAVAYVASVLFSASGYAILSAAAFMLLVVAVMSRVV